MLARQSDGIDIARTCSFQRACTLRQCRPRRHNIIQKQDILPADIHPLRHSKGSTQFPLAFRTRMFIERSRLTRTDKQREERDVMRTKP